MIRLFALLSLLAPALPGLSATASPQGASHPPAALSRAAFEDLFKWGDYDSLIRVLEPLVASEPPAGARATRADSAERGRANLYLGVAYWASGRQEQGVQAFTRAARLDTTLRLDPLYSTPEMEARFAAVLEAERNAPPPAGGGRGAAGAVGPARPRNWSWLWWSGAVMAAGAAGGWYYLQSQEKPDDITIIIDPEKPQ